MLHKLSKLSQIQQVSPASLSSPFPNSVLSNEGSRYLQFLSDMATHGRATTNDSENQWFGQPMIRVYMLSGQLWLANSLPIYYYQYFTLSISNNSTLEEITFHLEPNTVTMQGWSWLNITHVAGSQVMQNFVARFWICCHSFPTQRRETGLEF